MESYSNGLKVWMSSKSPCYYRRDAKKFFCSYVYTDIKIYLIIINFIANLQARGLARQEARLHDHDGMIMESLASCAKKLTSIQFSLAE